MDSSKELVELGDTLGGADASQGDEKHIEEQFLERVLIVEVSTLHIAAQSLEDVTDDGIVDVAAEEAFVNAALHEADEVLLATLLLAFYVLHNLRILADLVIESGIERAGVVDAAPVDEDDDIEHIVLRILGIPRQLFGLHTVIALQSLEDEVLLGIVQLIERTLRYGKSSGNVVHLDGLHTASYEILQRGVEYAVSERQFIVGKSLYFLHKLVIWVQSYKKKEKTAAFS